MTGSLVLSKSGNDKGVFYYVVSADDKFVYLADGKKRKLEAPKKKNVRHVEIIGRFTELDHFRKSTEKHETVARNKVLYKIIKNYYTV